jgi:hypothetical protein
MASEFLVRHMANEICQDITRMNREGANSARFAAPVEFNGKTAHLRSSIGRRLCHLS